MSATASRKFGPKSVQHLTVGRLCPACNHPLDVGCFTTLIPLGPGDDSVEQEKARDGRPYNAVTCEVHWACATGEP